MLVDSHCHLDMKDFSDFEEMLERAHERGVNLMLNVGNNIDEMEEQLEISKKYPYIFTAVGVHPHNASKYKHITAKDIMEKLDNKKIVAIGETGLDYYYNYSAKEDQIRLFIEHIKAAQETGLPIILHARDADDDLIKIMGEQYKIKPFTGVVHCFSSSKKLADFALKIGFYISASGIITFNKSNELREIFAKIPNERLLIETDAPFLAPVPKRGRRNEPAFVFYVAERLAAIKDLTVPELAKITTDNFCTLFRRADKGKKRV